MARTIAIVAVLAASAVGVGLAAGLAVGDDPEPQPENPWSPTIKIVSPRNGSVQTSHAVVVKADVENFRLAPEHFGGEPQLREGHLRFALNRVPDCVDPAKLEKALNSAIGRGRLVGRSMDFPRYAGPNGILGARVGTSGSYSPGTRPEIYYQDLPAGLYRLVITLAENNGQTTPNHAVTNFQIEPRPGAKPKPCPPGKVSSAKAASLR